MHHRKAIVYISDMVFFLCLFPVDKTQHGHHYVWVKNWFTCIYFHVPVHSNVKSFVSSCPSLLPDVSGGFVLCLFCKGSVGELHEEHNNSAGEALWHPQLPNRCHWWELRDRWVGLSVTAVILLFSWQPLCHRLPSPFLFLSLGRKDEWVTEVFELQIKDSSDFQEEGSECVCVYVYVVSHSVKQGHNRPGVCFMLWTAGLWIS